MAKKSVAAILVATAAGDFVYVDFNNTQGLVLNGDALTTACGDVELRHYGEREGRGGEGGLAEVYGEDDETSWTTRSQGNASATRQAFGHRDAYADADERCAGRVRLTPSQPRTRGSVWYRLPRPVFDGFETLFTFKVSDHSKHCSRHRDLDFSLQSYESCSVHGGDGLAFVVHVDPNETAALGRGGGDMGYGGIRSSIAVELDMNYNPGADAVPNDHVELRSRGARENSALGEGQLAPFVAHDLADGKLHVVKVRYVPTIDTRYFASFAANPSAARFMVDGGESRRLGLFLVWLDDGIETDEPAIALPTNLPELLELDGDGRAFVGFTAATGTKWQKHDLLSWFVCDRPDCDTGSAERDLFFDYHTSSKTTAGPYHPYRYDPGDGFGGTVQGTDAPIDSTPTRHTSPDRQPEGPEPDHFADSRHVGVADGAASQAPPNTNY